MRMSHKGLMALISHEGIVLSPYKDSVGVWTIGIGHTAAAGAPDPRKAGKLTVADAFELLSRDIAKYEAGVNRAVKVPLKQHEYDALVSFHYNTGAIGRASFVKKLNAGDRVGAIKGIMDWRKPPEIIKRRTAERDLFKTGKYPPPFATLYPATANGSVQWGKGQRIDLTAALARKPTEHVHEPADYELGLRPKPAPQGKSGGKTTIAALLAAAVVAIGAAIAKFACSIPFISNLCGG